MLRTAINRQWKCCAKLWKFYDGEVTDLLVTKKNLKK
jgi:hypothetical protein